MAESRSIIILTGPIQTGKTTSLIKWRADGKDVSGIVQPVIDGKRYLQDVSTGEIRPLEAENNTDKILQVGKFRFLKSSFEWAKIVLLHAAEKKPNRLVIDEFGKLELEGKGLQPVIAHLVNNDELLKSTSLIIVVRDSLLKQAISFLNITNKTRVISSITELN